MHVTVTLTINMDGYLDSNYCQEGLKCCWGEDKMLSNQGQSMLQHAVILNKDSKRYTQCAQNGCLVPAT